MTDLEKRFKELRQFNKTLVESRDKNIGDESIILIDALKHETIELVADQIYDKLTILFNERRKRLGIKGGANIVEPIREYDSFDIDDNSNLTFVHKNEVIGLGNIKEGLLSPSKMIAKLGVNRLRLVGFINIIDEDIYPHRARYKDTREKLRKLDDTLSERSKAIPSSSTTDRRGY